MNRRRPGALMLMPVVMLVLSFAATLSHAEPLKVFISVDMEGVTGAFDAREVSRNSDRRTEYEYFRKIMTLETNAAIEGAFAAGASEVLVREGHGGMNHLMLDLVDERVRVVRGATHPQSMMVMMEGFDSSFDAVVLIGYHASAGYPNSILPHTMSGGVEYFKINGVALSEGSFNALIAGAHDVPVVMFSGDKAACEEARQQLGANLETVAVKEELNGGVITVHPKVAQAQIRRAVERGVRNRAKMRPYKLSAPYVATLKTKKPNPLMPGAQFNERGEAQFRSDELYKALNALVQMW